MEQRRRGHNDNLVKVLPMKFSLRNHYDALFAERAAILEIDGRLDRNTANYRAFMMWLKSFVGRSSQIVVAHRAMNLR